MTKVRIIHKDGWMGHPQGSIVDVNNPHAAELEKRKVAKKPEKGKPAGKDKMVKRARNKSK